MSEEFAKIIFIGLSNAGKTSIYKRCFEHAQIKDIENLRPTKGVSKNQVTVNHISRGMAIWDFGGQDLYRKDYLENPNIFLQTEVIIFVVDLLALDELSTAIVYFKDILRVFKDNYRPKIYVFLHKSDPDNQEQILQAMAKSSAEIIKNFGDGIHFFLTSIYNNTACIAMNSVLFQSLPEEVINLIFSKYTIESLMKSVEKEFGSEGKESILEMSEMLGIFLTKKIYALWKDFSLKNVEKKQEKLKHPAKIESFMKDGRKYFKLLCPFYRENEKCSNEKCSMAKNVIKGIVIHLFFEPQKFELKMEENRCYFHFNS